MDWVLGRGRLVQKSHRGDLLDIQRSHMFLNNSLRLLLSYGVQLSVRNVYLFQLTTEQVTKRVTKSVFSLGKYMYHTECSK